MNSIVWLNNAQKLDKNFIHLLLSVKPETVNLFLCLNFNHLLVVAIHCS